MVKKDLIEGEQWDEMCIRDSTKAIYLKDELAGFAIHLVKK